MLDWSGRTPSGRRGRAHAEAFNVTGKTDILIRHDGRSLFICECKFWTGQDGFTATVDQPAVLGRGPEGTLFEPAGR
jgi:hypothetical protein